MGNNKANATNESALYSVNLWGSHPDAGNDDCWMGQDFATLEQARAAFNDLDGSLLQSRPERRAANPRVYYAGWAYAELTGPGVHEIRPNPDQRAVSARRREEDRSAADERREAAMQAGMAFGVDGYNDAMGW